MRAGVVAAAALHDGLLAVGLLQRQGRRRLHRPQPGRRLGRLVRLLPSEGARLVPPERDGRGRGQLPGGGVEELAVLGVDLLTTLPRPQRPRPVLLTPVL